MNSLRVLYLFLGFALSGCGGPLLVVPGGALSGAVHAVPESFAFAAEAGTIQLETKPEDPYSVNIACAVVGEALYISAGDTRTTWVENMDANPHVRVRIAGKLYELAARRVTDDAEMHAFAEVWTTHSWARDPTKLAEAWVYQLGAR